jgi:hypothetical protein
MNELESNTYTHIAIDRQYKATLQFKCIAMSRWQYYHVSQQTYRCKILACDTQNACKLFLLFFGECLTILSPITQSRYQRGGRCRCDWASVVSLLLGRQLQLQPHTLRCSFFMIRFNNNGNLEPSIALINSTEALNLIEPIDESVLGLMISSQAYMHQPSDGGDNVLGCLGKDLGWVHIGNNNTINYRSDANKHLILVSVGSRTAVLPTVTTTASEGRRE